MKLKRYFIAMVLVGLSQSPVLMADELADNEYSTYGTETQDTTTYTPSTYDSEEDTTTYDTTTAE